MITSLHPRETIISKVRWAGCLNQILVRLSRVELLALQFGAKLSESRVDLLEHVIHVSRHFWREIHA